MIKNIKEPYLVVIDSDGTLRHSDGTITDRTKEVLKRLIEKNNIVALCTARPRYYTLEVSENK